MRFIRWLQYWAYYIGWFGIILGFFVAALAVLAILGMVADAYQALTR